MTNEILVSVVVLRNGDISGGGSYGVGMGNGK